MKFCFPIFGKYFFYEALMVTVVAMEDDISAPFNQNFLYSSRGLFSRLSCRLLNSSVDTNNILQTRLRLGSEKRKTILKIIFNVNFFSNKHTLNQNGSDP